MTKRLAHLADRGVVSVTGPEALPFLDNLVTNDLEGIEGGEARYAALLSPQGKMLFDFLIVKTGDGFLLDVARDKAAEMAKRLTLYKLRAKIDIVDISATSAIVWSAEQTATSREGGRAYADPRHEGLGSREVIPLSASERGSAEAYHACRIALGVPEGGRDFAYGDAFPHEANMDRLHGISFTKGCFVGQEVVARMQHKTVVRKRIVTVTSATSLTSGGPITVGEAAIGTVGSVAGTQGLAMVRLDRIVEALDKGQPILAAGQPITVDAAMLTSFRAETVAKAAEKAARL